MTTKNRALLTTEVTSMRRGDTVNVTGDAAVTLIIARSEQLIDLDVYRQSAQ